VVQGAAARWALGEPTSARDGVTNAAGATAADAARVMTGRNIVVTIESGADEYIA